MNIIDKLRQAEIIIYVYDKSGGLDYSYTLDFNTILQKKFSLDIIYTFLLYKESENTITDNDIILFNDYIKQCISNDDLGDNEIREFLNNFTDGTLLGDLLYMEDDQIILHNFDYKFINYDNLKKLVEYYGHYNYIKYIDDDLYESHNRYIHELLDFLESKDYLNDINMLEKDLNNYTNIIVSNLKNHISKNTTIEELAEIIFNLDENIKHL